jgi:DNA polymerase III subunit delta'
MSLQDIKGQQRAVAMIKKLIENKTINGSFLFYGGRGIGKHLAALNMAKALNCTGEQWLSDDTCTACRKIEKSIHPDIIQLTIPIPDDASQMDTVVQTIEWLNTPVFEGRQKVLLVDDASELNVHAQNALLKTLEEPPPWATIILVTAAYTRLLPTVQSRLIKIGFNRLSTDAIKQILGSITRLSDEEIDYLSLVSDGRIRYLRSNDMEDDVKKIVTLLAGIDDPASMVKLAEKFKAPSLREHFDQIIDIIQTFMIDTIIAGGSPNMIRNKGFTKEIEFFSKRFEKHAIINAVLSLEEARAAYELNVNPQMIMEHVLFELIGDAYAG